MIMTTSDRSSKSQTASGRFSNLPLYELRVKSEGKEGYEIAIWQLPSPATPRIRSPEHVASLKGAALRLIEPRMLKKLSRAKIHLGVSQAKEKNWSIDEDLALNLGLMFRALSPMRHLDRIREVADGIEEMSREEAAYWLGMSMHRKYPRRVLAALRLLLTTR